MPCGIKAMQKDILLPLIKYELVKILGYATIGNKEFSCESEVLVMKKTESLLYVSWKMYSENGIIAARSKNIFIGGAPNSTLALDDIIINDITKFRIGHNYIFKNVEILPG